MSRYPGATRLDRNKQTFTVKYLKPFATTELNDVKLISGYEYNITSYFGCYQKASYLVFDPNTAEYTRIYEEGRDPNVFWKESSTDKFYGCRGSQQGRTGYLDHDLWLDGVIFTTTREL